MSADGRSEEKKTLSPNAWLKLDNFTLQGRCVMRRPHEPDFVAAEWRIPARAGLAVIGAILRQLLMCWWRILRQNTKVAVRWLFWRI